MANGIWNQAIKRFSAKGLAEDLSLAAVSAPLAAQDGSAPQKPPVPQLQADGSVQMPPVQLDMPGSFTDEARHAFLDYYNRGGDPAFKGDVTEIRKIYDTQWAGPVLERWEANFPVKTERRQIAGVSVDIVTPRDGVAPDRQNKVLINFHGGGFFIGNGGIGGRLEAVPMAGLGGYRVVTVDYRQAPEARYPAATDDALAVYRELLKQYGAANIGVYGSSAGGMLAGQLIARLQMEGLALPSSVTIMAAGLAMRGANDSQYWLLGLTGATVRTDLPVPQIPSYFGPEDFADAQAFPAESAESLAKFPPTLVLTSSRDALLGNALDTHVRLIEAGVDADLYVRHGFGHSYFTQVADLPEAIAAWRVTVAFFDRHFKLKSQREQDRP